VLGADTARAPRVRQSHSATAPGASRKNGLIAKPIPAGDADRAARARAERRPASARAAAAK
jgi:hypothetical protein